MSERYSAQQLSKRIAVPPECPDIILSIAPCRSGTTAQLRVFAENGIPAMYQPTKALLRSAMAGEQANFSIPQAKRVFIKETLGPYTREESTIDPLEILLLAGVPEEKITLITMMRNPINTACSWLEQFAFGADKPTLLDNLCAAYDTASQIHDRSGEVGINEYPFVYEALRDNDPALVIERLFNILGLPFDEKSLLGWEHLPPMGSEESGIWFAKEPAQYTSVHGHLFHEKVETSTSLGYFPKSAEEISRSIDDRDVSILLESGAFDIYDRVRRECGTRLDITIDEVGILAGEGESQLSSSRHIDRR